MSLHRAPARGQSFEPYLVFLGGRILTTEADRPRAQAISLRADKILGLGSDEEILAMRGNGTRALDLNGQALISGTAVRQHVLVAQDLIELVSGINPQQVRWGSSRHVREQNQDLADPTVIPDGSTQLEPGHAGRENGCNDEIRAILSGPPSHYWHMRRFRP